MITTHRLAKFCVVSPVYTWYMCGVRTTWQSGERIGSITEARVQNQALQFIVGDYR